MSETDYANNISGIHVILASFSILSLFIVTEHFKGIFNTAQSRLRSGTKYRGPSGRERGEVLGEGQSTPPHQLVDLGSSVSVSSTS